MKSDYQRYVERCMYNGDKVAVADTGSKKTTYLWHTGDRYRMVEREWSSSDGYEWTWIRDADSETRRRIFERNNVAAVSSSDVPNRVGRRARDSDDEGENTRIDEEYLEEESDDPREKIIKSLIRDQMGDEQ